MTDQADLRRRWAAVAGESDRARELGEDLLRRWTEPHRRYHTADHLSAVLRHLDRLGPPPSEVALAAFYHDAVYRPGESGNEQASADLARSALNSLACDQETVAQVARLVLLTVSHRAEPSDRSGSLLCDADLAVLGGTVDEYDCYRRAVRQEYAFLPEPDWRSGRTQVLVSLTARSSIFSTETARAAWEEAARRNMARELSELSRA